MSEAWELAHAAASDAGVRLRPLPTLEDADEIIRVLLATWGDGQIVPREMVRALAESGNVPYGAFAGDELVGYVLGWAGVDPDEGLHVHSHMLAAVPDRRHGGIGYALKLAQRAQALDQGITSIRWTFDPLVARNAYFNLAKLGAVVDRFERNFYGEMADSVNRGDRSDRFFVRWDLEAEPGPWSVPVADDATLVRRTADGTPQRSDGVDDAALIEIPADHVAMRTSDPGLAAAWREVVADAAEACLGRGLVGAGFDRERGAYVFGRTYERAGLDAGTRS
ncbi:MAG: GNAT family N-acetyltransferase [Actinomycetota bacterium]